MTIDTAVGPADVLHRLAFVVECTDAVVQRRPATDVRIGREVPAALLGRGYDPAWPCIDLAAHGPGRALLLFDRRTPVTTDIAIRITDLTRRYVARRFAVPPWKLTEIIAAEANPPVVPAFSRLLRPWLLPAAGYRVSRSMTSIRGRVTRNATPVRWARLTAIGPGNQPVGWAHADERGEFLLVISGTGTLPPPAPSELAINLVVTAPPLTPVSPAADPYDDLVVEVLARSASPPAATDLDSDVLRGRALPAGYLANTTAVPQLQVPVGQELILTADIPFAA